MIESRSLVHRYALALFQIAEAQDRVERFKSDLALVGEVMAEGSLKPFFLHPRVPDEVKKEKVDKFLGGSIDPMVRNLICLLIDRGRESLLPDMLEEYVLIADEAAGLARAKLETVYTLSEAELDALRPRLEAVTGKKLDIHQEEKPELLGGIRVRVGSKLIDGSVAAKLKALREQLMEFKI